MDHAWSLSIIIINRTQTSNRWQGLRTLLVHFLVPVKIKKLDSIASLNLDFILCCWADAGVIYFQFKESNSHENTQYFLTMPKLYP